MMISTKKISGNKKHSVEDKVNKKQRKYLHSNGKFRAQIICPCKRNCAKRIDVLKQREFYDAFKACINYTERTNFLRSISTRESMKENLNPVVKHSKKEKLHKYFLLNENNEQVQVCLRFLSNILCLKRSLVFRAISSIERNPNAEERRGKTNKKRIDARDIKFVAKFIEKFPSYESNSSTKYLHPRLNVTKMYKMYNELCQFQQRKALTETMFRKVFKKDFNLKFVKLSKRKCQQFSEYEHKRKPLVLSNAFIQHYQEKQDKHLSLVRCIRDNFLKTVETGKSVAGKTEVITFGFYRPVEIPYLKSNDAFYRRALWLYSFCILDELRNIAYIYVWDESIAKNTSEEIGSCLIKHILQFIPKDTEKLVLFSDPCSINRNIRVLLALIKSFDISIKSKIFLFLVIASTVAIVHFLKSIIRKRLSEKFSHRRTTSIQSNKRNQRIQSSRSLK